MAAPSDKKSKPEASNPAADEKATCTFEDAGRCFKDTNLLILGSSTSRHWFFVLQDVLTHNETRTTGSRSDFVSVLSPRRRYATGYREHEKSACGGGKLAWSEVDQIDASMKVQFGSRCSTLIQRTHTLLTFVWVIPFREGVHGSGVLHNAGSVLVRDSEANNMTVSRVLVNGGLELAINFEDARLWRGRSKPSWQAIVNSTLPNITRPWKPVFEARTGESPIGTKSSGALNLSTSNSVTWRTATRVCCEKPRRPVPTNASCVNRNGVDMGPVRSRLRAVNEEAVKQIAARESRITVLDAWNITGYDTCPAYEDWVHHPSLAFLHLESWMRDVLGCSCTGAPRTNKAPWNVGPVT